MSSFVAAWVGPTVLGSTVLASAATGAIIAGGVTAASSLASGKNIGESLQSGLQGAVVGGIGGAIGGGISAAMGGTAGAAGGADAINFAAADATQLAAQGIPASQIEGMLTSSYGLDAVTAADMAQLANQGMSANTITQNLASVGTASGTAPTSYSGISAANAIKGMLGSGAQLAGGYLQQQSARDAAATQAQAQIRAAQIAADAAKFRPVGVTSRFGASQFGKDAEGNLTSAGYVLSPEMKAQQDKLMGVSEGALSQYQGAQEATAPMGQAAQTMMTLGQGYLGTSPQEQAAKYMAEQQALLGTSREREMAALQNKLQQQGRLGLATGGTTTGMMAANPELEAWYNAKRQQDLGLAAQATQGGMDYAKFGAGMVGSGGQMLRDQYGTQTSAYAPYQTALGGATTLEGLGQQTMEQGINIGAKGTAGTAASGMLLGQGMQNAAATQFKADATSPWATMLSGAGSALQQYGQPQQQYAFNPYTGQPVEWGT